MNNIILTGNIVRNIETKEMNGGRKYITNAIAVRRDFKNKNNEYDTDFINITIFSPQAEFVEKYCNKGTKVLLTGRLEVRETQNQSGEKVTFTNVVVNTIEMLDKKQKEEQREEQPKPTTNAEALNRTTYHQEQLETTPYYNGNVDSDDLPF